LDSEKRRALSQFYREEFAKHIRHLQSSGAVCEKNRDAVDGACRWLTRDLERVCWHADFPAIAESLLQSFDTLTRLSSLDPSKGH